MLVGYDSSMMNINTPLAYVYIARDKENYNKVVYVGRVKQTAYALYWMADVQIDEVFCRPEDLDRLEFELKKDLYRRSLPSGGA